jgi:DNA-binding transcriptional LysR family regulator
MAKELNFDLKQIKSFLAAVDEKSFTRASRILGVGQATISHHIQLLEENLGVNLIGRSSKSFELTAEGIIFRKFCDRLMEDLDGLGGELNSERTTGVIAIAASTIPSTYILPGVLARVYERLPGVMFRIEVFDSREAIEKVKDKQVDAAVTGKVLKHPSLAYTHIWDDEIVLIAPAGRYPGKITLAGLKELPFVVREKGSGTRYYYEEFLNKNGVRMSDLRVVLECTTSESVREAVLGGMGVAFISNLAVERDIGLKRISIIKVEKAAIKRKFYLVNLKNRTMSKAVKALLDEFRAARGSR